MAELQTQRRELSGQKSDLDNPIIHYTELVLLSPTPAGPHMVRVFALYRLGTLLLSRYPYYKQVGDLESSITYLRSVRVNFHLLEAFHIPHASGDLSLHLFCALAFHLNLTSTRGEIAKDLEEMVILIPDFITVDSDILNASRRDAIKAFGFLVTASGTEIYRQENTQRAFNRAIQVLRDAAVLNPDLTFTLATCLAVRFETTRVMNDCEEVIINFDKVVSTFSPGNNLTGVERRAMSLSSGLLVSRQNLSPTPEHLEDAIHRLRTFVPYYALDDEDRTEIANILDAFTHKRFNYFGVTGRFGGAPFNPKMDLQPRHFLPGQRGNDLTRSQIQEKLYRLGDFTLAIMNGETMDVEAAAKGSRKLIPLHQSSDHWSISSDFANVFAGILLHAYQRTEKLDYLNEAITTYQDLYKVSAAPKLSYFDVGRNLHHALRARLKLLGRPQDVEELMQLSSNLANDGSGEEFTRFEISCFWATTARASLLPSASTAYETAMSLLQESLFFCPTLQTQHHRLADALKEGGRFPSDYASYRIENGQVEQAI